MQSPTIDDLAELLVPAWADALEAEVTLESDFIALGGDSLSAIAIADVVAERYGSFDEIDTVALQAVFEAPTLRGMAKTLARFMNEQASE